MKALGLLLLWAASDLNEAFRAKVYTRSLPGSWRVGVMMSSNGQPKETTWTTILNENAKFFFRVRPPSRGFLYILQEGPTAADTPALFPTSFPSTEVNAGAELDLPPKARYQFFPRSGVKQVIFVLSQENLDERVQRARPEDIDALLEYVRGLAAKGKASLHPLPVE